MEEQELNRKLAEWAGFHFIKVDLIPSHKRPDDYLTNYWSAFNHWVYPDGTKTKGNCPDFTQSLDACFKWLVPKLIGKGFTVAPQIVISSDEVGWFASIYPNAPETKGGISVVADTAASVLCLAIEKLIEGKG